MLFIIELNIISFEYWHVCASLMVVRCRAPVGYVHIRFSVTTRIDEMT